jgi:hypothetical protein
VLFGLDALQVRGQVRGAPAQFAFNVASVVATFKCVLAIVGLTTIGIAAFKGPKPARADKSAATGGLVMGSKSGGVTIGKTSSSTSTTV